MLLLLLAVAVSLITESVSICDLNGNTLKCDGETLKNVVSRYSSLKDTITELHISTEETTNFELRKKHLPFPSLRKLVVSHNIDELEENCFSNIKQLQELSLSNNSIKEFPQEALQDINLEKLVLSHNQISRINPITHLDTLKELDLSSNRIALIDRDAFKNLSNLVDVDLSYNRILMLPERLFAELKNLRVVNLMANKFESIPDSIFHNNVDLNNLVLSRNDMRKPLGDDFLLKNNRIVHLDMSYFGLRFAYMHLLNNLPSLKVLNLEHNSLSQLPYGYFKSLVNIERLKLSHCHMWKLALIFRFNVELDYLDISYNEIESLPEKLFETNYKLTFLNISGNRLQTLPFQIFDSTVLKTIDLSYNWFRIINWHNLDIPSLENLLLRGNKIKELKSNYDISLNLKYIDLRDNNLFFLEGDFFKKLSKLVRFEFIGNPFNCKCLDELMAILSKKNIQYTKGNYFDGALPLCIIHHDECIRNISFYNPNFKDFRDEPRKGLVVID